MIGVKVLGASSPIRSATFYSFNADPTTDPLIMADMKSGIAAAPSTLSDYRVMVTAKPFPLAIGQSKTVAFGLTFGNGVADLKVHADTMESLYERNLATGVEQSQVAEIPGQYILEQNYPNPFNPATTIRFDLPEKSKVRLHIFNLLGQQVAELANEEVNAGYFQKVWTTGVASGLYFYRLEAISVSDPNKRFVDVKKMLLLK
jgi:hypothetical protein